MLAWIIGKVYVFNEPSLEMMVLSLLIPHTNELNNKLLPRLKPFL